MTEPHILTTRDTLLRLWQVIRPNWVYLALSVSMSIAVSAIMLVAMARVGLACDLILSGAPGNVFWSNAVLIIVLFAAISVVTLVQIYTMAVVGQRLARDLRAALFAKMCALPMAYFDAQTTGDLMSRMTNDIDQINTSFSENLTSVIEAIVNVAGTFIAMALLSVKLTLWAAIVFPLFFLLTAIVSRISSRLFSNYQRSLGNLNTYVEEHLSAQNMLILFDYQTRNLTQFVAAADRVCTTYAAAQTSSVMAPVMTFINHLVYVVIAIIGGLSIVHTDTLSIGILFTFLLYMRRFATPLNQLAQVYNAFQATVSASARIFGVLDAPDEHAALGNNRQSPFPNNHSIAFEHVDFSYADGTPVLHDICVTLPAQKTIAIVGATGAGKTTLTNLLLSHYLPDQGRITIGGTDLASIPLAEIHRHIGVMPQQPMLFDATVRENIAFARPDASDEDITTAARATGFDQIVQTLPQGYDTVLHNQGAALSQGERQLLAITRALLHDNDILILDEPTSSLDAHTEKIVQQAFNALRREASPLGRRAASPLGRTEKTLLIIAHRLSTIRDADYILVMKRGSIVEAGTHDALIARHGYYHRLYSSQF